MQNYAPGTVVPDNTTSEPMFSIFRTMIKAADGLTSSQICTITGLEYSTLQNWVKRGYVSHPIKKKYYEGQVARILIISALRDCLKMDEIITLLHSVNGCLTDTGDDIIPDADLYDYLCRIIKSMDDFGVSSERVNAAVSSVTADYTGPTPDSKHTLTVALNVMVYAYVSGKLKNEAAMYYAQIKEVK